MVVQAQPTLEETLLLLQELKVLPQLLAVAVRGR
jgi:hypothetical protein